MAIPIDEQQRIIKDICKAARGTAKRKVMIHGAALALGNECPAHWLMCIMSGRVEELFEVAEDGYDGGKHLLDTEEESLDEIRHTKGIAAALDEKSNREVKKKKKTGWQLGKTFI